VWGDSTLWYLIADANGLTNGDHIAAGQVISIPNKVSNFHNTASTFRVYNPGQAIGDTLPYLPTEPLPPPPPSSGGGCGGFVQFLAMVVAIVVAAYTGYVMGPGLLSGATAGAAATVASQGVLIAGGEQKGFDWKGVAMGAIGGAVTAGVTQGIPMAGSDAFVRGLAQGAVGSVVTQGVGVAIGLQSHFDWRGVAASAIATGVSAGVADSIGRLQATPGGMLTNDVGQAMTRNLAAGLAAGVASGLVRGGSFQNNLPGILRDVAASTIGNSIADQMTAVSTQKIYGIDDVNRPAVQPQLADGFGNSDVPLATTSYGGYTPADLTRGGYPARARFIDTPVDRDGYDIQGAAPYQNDPSSGLKPLNPAWNLNDQGEPEMVQTGRYSRSDVRSPAAESVQTEMSYGEQMGHVGDFIWDLGKGVRNGIVNGVPKMVMGIASTLQQGLYMNGLTEAGVDPSDAYNIAKQSTSQWPSGELLPYANPVQGLGGFVGEFASPFVYGKGLQLAGSGMRLMGEAFPSGSASGISVGVRYQIGALGDSSSIELSGRKLLSTEGSIGANTTEELVLHARAAEKGYPGVQVTPNGGPTFAKTDYLFPIREGQQNVLNLEMTGSRRLDFKAANEAAGLQDLVPRGADSPSGYVWHHVDDFNPATGTSTLELVERGAHNATIPHKGSVFQWEQLNGVPYRR
jgi:hypothetical protein